MNIPSEEKCFDIVIANMMLYHVPDLTKALSEVARVLKDNGRFYCAIGGEHGILRVPKEAGMFVCKCPNRRREYLGKVF